MPFRPLVNFGISRKYMPNLDAKIACCDAEWMLGGCILGFIAPCQTYPLSKDEYQLQAWLLFERIYPEKSSRLLDVMKNTTGFDLRTTGGHTKKPVERSGEFIIRRVLDVQKRSDGCFVCEDSRKTYISPNRLKAAIFAFWSVLTRSR